MTLTHKERTRLALERQAIGRIPTQMGFTGAMSQKIAAHLCISPAELPAVGQYRDLQFN